MPSRKIFVLTSSWSRSTVEAVSNCGSGQVCYQDAQPVNCKAQWFSDALTLMEGWGNLEAFCYSQVSGFNEGDFTIGTSPDSLAAFQALANDPFFAES